jgi:hypothetical protein
MQGFASRLLAGFFEQLAGDLKRRHRRAPRR